MQGSAWAQRRAGAGLGTPSVARRGTGRVADVFHEGPSTSNGRALAIIREAHHIHASLLLD